MLLLPLLHVRVFICGPCVIYIRLPRYGLLSERDFQPRLFTLGRERGMDPIH